MLKKKRTQVILACLSLVILALYLWAPEAVSANSDGSLFSSDESVLESLFQFFLGIISKFISLFRG